MRGFLMMVCGMLIVAVAAWPLDPVRFALVIAGVILMIFAGVKED